MKIPQNAIRNLYLYGIFIVLILIVLSYCLDIKYHCLFDNLPLTLSILPGLISGIFSAVLVVAVQESVYNHKLKKYYSLYFGEYKRIEIGEDNKKKEELASIEADNLGLGIFMHYIGNHRFSIKADYWHSEGKVESTIQFNSNDGINAIGSYTYAKGSLYEGHYGNYTIHKLEGDPIKFLVLYQHIYPRLEFNPDGNHGWEVWQKK